MVRPVFASLLATLSLGLHNAAVADSVPHDGRIGYVMTNLFWSVYQTSDGKTECPNGYNDGPREQFTKLFPDPKGLALENTQLKQEIRTWHPDTGGVEFPFYQVEGELSYGMNLDGQVSSNDFIHPDGTPGIDNQVYRAVGCIIGFRGPDGVEVIFQDKAIADRRYNRMMIELTQVDDLTNDDYVEIGIYRGQDRLLTDATGGKIAAGGSQRVDTRWGKSLIRKTTGSISDSVLITEPVSDMIMPWMNLNVPTVQIFKDARFQLRLTSEGAQGLLAGYADVEAFYRQLIRNDSTHHLSNGQISAISLYQALTQLADAYPDPETGANTAISTALDVKMAQVFVIHE